MDVGRAVATRDYSGEVFANSASTAQFYVLEDTVENALHEEAGCRCFEILTSILEEHDDVYVSLACTSRLLVHGSQPLIEEVHRTIEEWKSKDPDELTDLIDLLPVNPAAALVKLAPVEVFKKVERQMSISVLITAHAFFESVLVALLRVTVMCDRERWLKEVRGRSVVFEDIESIGIDSCADKLIEREIRRVAAAGMPAMVSRLLNFCKGNVTTKSHFKNYTLDVDRLKALDQLRHDYAHRLTKATYSIVTADKDLRYLTITGVHLVTCVMEAYELKGQRRNIVPGAAERGE